MVFIIIIQWKLQLQFYRENLNEMTENLQLSVSYFNFSESTLWALAKYFSTKKKKKKKQKKKKNDDDNFLMLIDGCLVAAPIRSEQSRPLVQLLEEETNDSEFLG